MHARVFLLLFEAAVLLWKGVRGSAARPNVILIITDDQDIELGSLQAMPRTVRLLRERGVALPGYATTPICCPSRSSILTGLYAHSHSVHTNNNNCSGAEWRSVHEKRTIGVYAQAAGYATAYYGKYLNEYDGSYVPPGWDDWEGLVHNSRFYNYTLNVNGKKRKHGFDYERDYLTDVVTNRSIAFIDRVAARKAPRPFLLVLSYPAPHGPEDPAPRHADAFPHVESHRTPAWNYAPNPDKQWLLQRTGKMQPVHVAFTDLLHRRRLQTLQSVDEGVERIVQLLRDKSVLSSTYLIFTSDHGYHLGQFGLIKGKNMPYEFDIRVPFFIRGPGIERNSTVRRPVANIDLAPTIIDMMGAPIPAHVDGQSILDIVSEDRKDGAKWRETLLIERGKMPRMKSIRDRLERQKERFSKRARVRTECGKKKWQAECAPGQIFRCVLESAEWTVKRCTRKEEGECKCRGRREIPEEEEEEKDSYEALLDEFLLVSHSQSVREANEWFQGTFDVQPPRSKRAAAACSCDSKRQRPETGSPTTPIIPSDDLYHLGGDLEGAGAPASTPLPYSKRLCSLPQMSCFSHSDAHWRTPPLWPAEYGHFCFCQNSNNNTYWCLRTLNATHNFLYCEFVTEFISYYDLNIDPFQLSNAVFSLARHLLEQLSAQLTALRSCSGAQCHN